MGCCTGGEGMWTVTMVSAQQSCGCTTGLLAWGICAQAPVEFPGDPSLLKGKTDVAQLCFLAARGTLKVLGTVSSFLKVLQHSILLPQGPPGQQVHQFWCEKLAGETEPDGPKSWANPVVPSEYFQCSLVTSTSIGLCPFQRKGGVYVLFSCGEGHVCPSWTGRRREEVTCESWWLHPCCCSALSDVAALEQNWTGLHASTIPVSKRVWMPPYNRRGLADSF